MSPFIEDSYASKVHDIFFDQEKVEPIAVIGLSLRFPQDAVSVDSFWGMLMERRCAMTEIPKDRMNLSAFYHPDANRQDNIPLKGGHFLKDDIAAFDAPFFSITAADAAAMDPQQRILLETTYRALENAGIPLEHVAGSKTSVHTGCMTDDYKMMGCRDPEQGSNYAAAGISFAMLANRLSWFYNLAGPSINLDSACSSSLIALDLACQGLRNGDTDMGIVAGSSLIFNPDWMLMMSNMGLLSHDSRCFSFDHRANGYARGEGVGVVVIKRLADAIRDGNVIRAVIRSTGSNQDGYTPGITNPDQDAQERLIKDTYKKAGLDMKLTRYFEAHGTGTAVGDPIEANALGAAFRKLRSRQDPMYIGAVKSNIGHLEGASGLAGLIKAILVLERGVIPPNTNFERLNPRIDADYLHLKFPEEAVPWPSSGLRRASINSFGFGGANSHAVLDDAYNYLRIHNIVGNHRSVKQPPSSCHLECSSKVWGKTHLKNGVSHQVVNGDLSRSLTNGIPSYLPPKLLVWSASDESGLERLGLAYGQHFARLSLGADKAEEYLNDLAFTLNLRRSSFPWKSFMVVRSMADLQELNRHLSKPVRSVTKPRIGFVFTGQGAQWYAMGRELLVYTAFKSSLEKSELCLSSFGCQWSLIDELLKDESVSNVNAPDFSQPLCTALQIALVDLLRHFGIYPSAVIGHSSGEIAAAYCIGALCSRSACKIAYYRGTLAASLASRDQNRGAMLAVGLSESEVLPYIEEIALRYGEHDLVVACVNSQRSITISGGELQIDALKDFLDKKPVFSRKLNVGVAYHSPRMNEITFEYLKVLTDLNIGDSTSTNGGMISSVSGKRISSQELRDGQYWVRNMVSPVKFSEALQKLCYRSRNNLRNKLDRSHKYTIIVEDIIEIGPHAALQGPVREILRTLPKDRQVRYRSVLMRKKSALTTVLELAGQLHCLGHSINLPHMNRPDTSSLCTPVILTDLPEYSFNHSQAYWLESRMSKDFRFRRSPRLDLLGSPVLDWNSLEPRWRNFIKVSELPWIEDHKINGSLLYPAAGMLVMAIEATNQVAERGHPVTGFSIKNAIFHTPLHVSLELSGVETMLSLRPLATDSSKVSDVWEFRVYFYKNDKWTEACQGTIQIHYERSNTGVDDKETDQERYYFKEINEQSTRLCTDVVDSNLLYKHLENCGFNYGTAFQPLKSVTCNDDGMASGDVELFHSVPNGNPNHSQSHIIHPTTLDGFMQLVFAALTKGGKEIVTTMVPTRIRRLWLSSSGLSHPANDMVRAVASSKLSGYRGTRSSIHVFDKIDGYLRVEIEGLETTTVGKSNISSLAGSRAKQLCCHLEWKPDTTLLDERQILAYCEKATITTAEPTDFFQDLDLLLIMFVSETLDLLGFELPSLKSHFKKYVGWIRLQSKNFDNIHKLTERNVDWRDTSYRDSVCNRVQTANKQGQLYVQVGRNLARILRGEVDLSGLLLEGSLENDIFQSVYAYTSCFHAIRPYLSILTHKTPGMKILEVGAGSGGATAFFLNSLRIREDEERGGTEYTQYDFTDVSRSLVEKARALFEEHERMNYKTLDINEDPIKQGYDPGTYDLIFVANVLYATRDLSITLEHIRQLLKPDGKLILLEVTRPEILRSGFIFGLLPNWWLGTENYREWSPCISSKRWHDVLVQRGFSGTDAVMRDFQGELCHEVSLMVSTAVTQPQYTTFQSDAIIIVKEDSVAQQQHLAKEIQSRLLLSKGSRCEVLNLRELASKDDLKDAIYVNLSEIGASFFRELDHESYTTFQKVVASAKGILWVTSRGDDTPDNGMVDGLARVLRTEIHKLSFVTLALENREPAMERRVQTILSLCNMIANKSGDTDYEPTYLEEDGMLQIPRVVEAGHLNNECFARTLPQHSGIRAVGEHPPLQMAIESPGFLETLHFVEDTEHREPLLRDEVEVEVKAIGLNFSDYLIATGRSHETVFGSECAGVVSRIGQECDLKLGDRVCVASMHTYRNFVRSKSQSIAKIPDFLSFTEAATLPIAFITAYHALHHVAQIDNGDSILIHSAAGKVGQAATQIAAYLNMKVFATVNSDEEKELLLKMYNIPQDQIFYRTKTSLARSIKRMTRNRGVDVVFCWSSDEGNEELLASWECVATFGRLVDVYPHREMPSLDFKKNVSFSTVDVASIMQERPSLIMKALTAVIALVTAKNLHIPQPLRVHTISEVQQALDSLKHGEPAGSVVVEVNKDDLVLTTLDNKSRYQFDKNKTYVISGGLGGVGRTIARWMVSRGARNLILLSRSGPSSQAAMTLLEELSSEGVHVEAPACNIVDPYSLTSVLESCAQTMPPIKGCIQASMVLRDSVFQNMTYEDWKASIEPKVQGTWNLHKILPTGMDFFIMLSSITGVIGQGGQANYAAGNTYEDALAHYRVEHGEKAVSIDLGVMVSDGVLAENHDLMNRLLAPGLFIPLSHTELFALLDYYCDPTLALLTALTCQCIIGIETPAKLRAQGIEEAPWMRTPLFRHMYHMDGHETAFADVPNESLDLAKSFAAARSLSEAGATVTQGLIKKLARSLVSLSEEVEVDVNQPLHHYGVDSLLAVEVRTWIAKTFEADVPVFEIMGGATFTAVGMSVARKSQLKGAEWGD